MHKNLMKDKSDNKMSRHSEESGIFMHMSSKCSKKNAKHCTIKPRKM
jgi:hypothetical protein